MKGSSSLYPLLYIYLKENTTQSIKSLLPAEYTYIIILQLSYDKFSFPRQVILLTRILHTLLLLPMVLLKVIVWERTIGNKMSN